MNRKGFSIVELLVVLGIISIILSIGVVQLNRSSLGTKLNTTTEAAKSLLETAKSIAMTEHVLAAVVYNSTDNKFTITKQDIEDQDGDGDTTDFIDYKKGYEIPSGVTVVFSTAGHVTFTPFASVDNPGNPITISVPSLSKTRTINVNSTTGFISES